MVIIETPVFTVQVLALLSDQEYEELQHLLIAKPDVGKIIPHGGGLRKVRWSAKGRGKRGGARVIYYWAVSQDQILLLLIYSKNEQEDIAPSQLKRFKQVAEEEYK